MTEYGGWRRKVTRAFYLFMEKEQYRILVPLGVRYMHSIRSEFEEENAFSESAMIRSGSIREAETESACFTFGPCSLMSNISERSQIQRNVE